MVIFNDLRITEDRKYLNVDCQIEDVDGYDSFYIKKVDLIYYKNVVDFGNIGINDSYHAYTMYEKQESDEPENHLELTVTMNDIMYGPNKQPNFGTSTFENGLFYVAVTCDGGSAQDLYILSQRSCGSDSLFEIGVVLDWYAVYQNGMAYASKLAFSCGNSCEDPSGYEQFILHWYGLQLAIATCDWIQVAKLWEKFLRMFSRGVGGGAVVGSSGCGCRG